jgi:hypothetical protein
MVPHLGGGDISWILGLVVASGLYYLLHLGVDMLPRRRPRSSGQPLPADRGVTI